MKTFLISGYVDSMVMHLWKYNKFQHASQLVAQRNLSNNKEWSTKFNNLYFV